MSDTASVDALQHEIEVERARLAQSVSALRTQVELERRRRLRIGLQGAAGAAVAGFVAAGGVHATIRLLAVRHRRRRENEERGMLASLLRR
jgi:hypothetical protein